MKLHYIKLLSSFRGLKKGFHIEFPKENNSEYSLSPYCFIGVNGSGKSNILEVLSEIFFYLELFEQQKDDDLKKMSTPFGFEIEYSLPKFEFQLQQKGADFDIWSEADPIIRIIKKPNTLPRVITVLDNREYKTAYVKKSDLNISLPQHIIGYSSGMNELISNSFIKMGFHYIEQFENLLSEDAGAGSLDVNRMFFMDYDSNKLITIANFLFDNQTNTKKLSRIKSEIELDDLQTFSLSIRLRTHRNEPIKIPSELQIVIDKLINCATTYEEKTIKDENSINNNKGYKEYTLDYWVDDAVEKAFVKNFGTAQELYKGLYFLRLLNLYLLDEDIHDLVKNSNERVNISELLPKFSEEELIFSVTDISFMKENRKVFYRQLSDGEHQLLHVTGAVVLMENPGTLFLLDEPETHFNPDWRSKFVSILDDCLSPEEDSRNQELLLTTHSPFIISDCESKRVFKFFKNNNKINKKKYMQPGFQTFGTSVNTITMNLFDTDNTISYQAKKRLKEIQDNNVKHSMTKTQAQEKLAKFGDSIEKILMLKYLIKDD